MNAWTSCHPLLDVSWSILGAARIFTFCPWPLGRSLAHTPLLGQGRRPAQLGSDSSVTQQVFLQPLPAPFSTLSSNRVSELLTAVPLHQRPDLVEVCAELINEEWKKSKTSRMYSLQKSTDNFPMCLVLIKTQRAAEAAEEGKMVKTQLLGHARLSRIVSHPESLFVETVVVSRALRGQGYGRKLMEATECYAKSRGFRHLHLTTHDKQHFYAHLGYAASEPVQSMGFMSSVVPMEFLTAAAGLPPPPPLPPPAAHGSSAHLLPPPPGPPPCLLPLPGKPGSPGPIASSPPGEDPYGQTLLETPYRDLRGLPIFWMKKDI
uniref:N-alpha-acetyltransferase 80 n=1 Tax=Chelydra serpentina TaxID=8475 RepID=A0A8C3XHR7_CHESE